MISIDGSCGEGGGQIIRTAVALSAITGEPVRISRIREGRENPGLRPQHVSAIGAISTLCGAKVKGLFAGSKELEFTPGRIRPGRINVDVGTAGSVTLVLQALMLPAFIAKEPVSITVRGGTDVKWSPSVDYLKNVTLPLLERMGFSASIVLERRGYYPSGGGVARVEVRPATELSSLSLESRGGILSVGGCSHAHEGLREAMVASRQAGPARKTLCNRLMAEDMSFHGDIKISQEYVDSTSYGSGITLWARTGESVLGSGSLGVKGRRAELVGDEAAKGLLSELETGAALDRYMGDQIIPYLGFAGGVVSVSEITGHAITNVDIVNLFGLEVGIRGNRIIAETHGLPGIR